MLRSRHEESAEARQAWRAGHMAGSGRRPPSGSFPASSSRPGGGETRWEVFPTFPGAVLLAPGFGRAPGNIELVLWELRLSACQFTGLISDLHNFLLSGWAARESFQRQAPASLAGWGDSGILSESDSLLLIPQSEAERCGGKVSGELHPSR